MERGGGRIIRPLLECSRPEIEAYLNSRQLPYRLDRTNTSRKYLRNRIRLDLIPNIEETYSKNFKSHILHTAGIAREEDDYLDILAHDLLVAIQRVEGQSLFLKPEAIRPLHPAMRKRLIRQIINSICGDLRRISIRHIDAILRLFDGSHTSKQIHLPGSLVVFCREQEVEFTVKPNQSSRILGSSLEKIELKIPGFTEIHAASLKLNARLISKMEKSCKLALAHQSYLDFDKTGNHIIVRFFSPGDRFVPLGMTGTKKVKSFFIDEKVPKEQRKTIPILTTPSDDVIWIYGKRIAQGYRVTKETKNILFVEGIPDN